MFALYMLNVDLLHYTHGASALKISADQTGEGKMTFLQIFFWLSVK